VPPLPPWSNTRGRGHGKSVRRNGPGSLARRVQSSVAPPNSTQASELASHSRLRSHRRRRGDAGPCSDRIAPRFRGGLSPRGLRSRAHRACCTPSQSSSTGTPVVDARRVPAPSDEIRPRQRAVRSRSSEASSSDPRASDPRASERHGEHSRAPAPRLRSLFRVQNVGGGKPSVSRRRT